MEMSGSGTSVVSRKTPTQTQAKLEKNAPAAVGIRAASRSSVQRMEDLDPPKVPNIWGKSSSSPLLISAEEDYRRRIGKVRPGYQSHLSSISAIGQAGELTGTITGGIDDESVATLFKLNTLEKFALEAYGSPFKDEETYKYYMGSSPKWGQYGNGWNALTSALNKLPSFGALGIDLPLFRVDREESKLFKILRIFGENKTKVYVIHGIRIMSFGQKHLASTSLMPSNAHSAKKENYSRGIFCYRSFSARYMNNFSVQGMIDGGETLLLPGIVTEFRGITKRKWCGEMVDCAELVEVKKGELEDGVMAIEDFKGEIVTDWAKEQGYYKKPCFLTTACTASRGLPDDCQELKVLRRFRDNYVSQTPEGRDLIDRYYEIAPSIVAAILNLPGAQAVLDAIYEVISECVSAIQDERYDDASQLYYGMVDGLERDYLL